MRSTLHPFGKLLLVGSFVASAFGLSACTDTMHSGEKPLRKPNIIFILADDAGYGDFTITGQKRFTTPNIDRLGNEGLRFTQFYAGSTVCAPSRSALLTGLHTGHTPIRGNREIKPEGQEPLPDTVLTLAEMMKDAGYVTGAFGKWGLGYPDSEGDPLNQGFDQFYGYNCQRIAHRYYPTHLWDNDRRVDLPGNADGGRSTYSHDLIQERALRFIETHRDTSFFLFLPYTIPHVELIVPEDSIIERFRNQIPESAPFVGKDYQSGQFDPGGYASQSTPRAAYAAMMTRLDLYVGQILDQLADLGLDRNTIVLFSSDNGPNLTGGGSDPEFFDSNGPFRGYKRDLYEGGIRAPLLVRWPASIASGRVTDHVAAFWDLMPTMAEMVGARPSSTDGISFLPTLLNTGKQPVHAHLYWEFHEQNGKQAVRKGKWKAVRLNVVDDRDAPLELYDLETDPQEKYDVASRNPDIVREMAGIMKASHTDSDVFSTLNRAD